ncbi:glycosyltransferase [Pelagibius sp. Alg239-R121]|uniref:glycosyltransferase n=1 Tax=Pelagibius sp. Alg239-R121 TaxID=2993448 RepID=UPI0024A66E78|nr:glycosyltransferase [Pelagibius sp. Alg239-R121]
MNILYVGSCQGFREAGKSYYIPKKLVNGFTRNGHNVYAFNDRDFARFSNIFRSRKWGIRPLNKKLLEVCEEFAPDLIVLGHCEMIWNTTLSAVRETCPGVKIVYRNVDPLIHEQNVKDIQRRVGFVDGIFITTAGEGLKQFSSPDGFVTFMPNPVDRAVDTGRSFDNACSVDLFFAGGPLGESDARRDLMTSLLTKRPELEIAVHGCGINKDYLFGKTYMDRLAQSKMGLCLNRTYDYHWYSSDRLTQYMGNGLVTFLRSGTGFEEFFGNDDLAFYADEAELLRKLDMFMADDGYRVAVAKNGWKKAHEAFSAEKVTQYILDTTFGDGLTLNYCWPTEKY